MHSAYAAFIALAVMVYIGVLGLRLYKYWCLRRARKDIAAGRVPVDYSQVAIIVREENDSHLGYDVGLYAIRYQVARIRAAGFEVGQQFRGVKTRPEFVAAVNPHPEGSGEAKQWVRGYCQSANIFDPKPYMDAA